MTEPAQRHPPNNQYREIGARRDGKIDDVLHHRKACADQRPIDQPICHIVELIPQHQQEEQQPCPLDNLLGDARVCSLRKR